MSNCYKITGKVRRVSPNRSHEAYENLGCFFFFYYLIDKVTVLITSYVGRQFLHHGSESWIHCCFLLLCGIYCLFRTVPTMLLLFTSAEEAQILIGLVASIWAYSPHFPCYFITITHVAGKIKKTWNLKREGENFTIMSKTVSCYINRYSQPTLIGKMTRSRPWRILCQQRIE